MKIYLAAAGALLLGTSALAWAPLGTGEAKWSEAGAKPGILSPDSKDQMKVAVLDALGDAKAEQMHAAQWTDDAVKAMPAGATAKFSPAATRWIDESTKAYAPWGDAAKLKPIAAGWTADGMTGEPVDSGKPDLATGAKVKTELADEAPVHGADSETPLSPTFARGVGGPEEAVEGALAPRLASRNYPPCNPGPGDDNCIQLYEPGVRAAVASWNAPTGGLTDDSATTAMGGPYEPVDEETKLADGTEPAKPADGKSA